MTFHMERRLGETDPRASGLALPYINVGVGVPGCYRIYCVGAALGTGYERWFWINAGRTKPSHALFDLLESMIRRLALVHQPWTA
jgi:hypothetical protein